MNWSEGSDNTLDFRPPGRRIGLVPEALFPTLALLALPSVNPPAAAALVLASLACGYRIYRRARRGTWPTRVLLSGTVARFRLETGQWIEGRLSGWFAHPLLCTFRIDTVGGVHVFWIPYGAVPSRVHRRLRAALAASPRRVEPIPFRLVRWLGTTADAGTASGAPGPGASGLPHADPASGSPSCSADRGSPGDAGRTGSSARRRKPGSAAR